MKNRFSALALVFLLLAGASCRDKDKDPQPQQPEPVKYGKINFKVTTYDSLGNVEPDNSGVKIMLQEDNISAITNSEGLASFSNLPYGSHTPVLEKAGYDGPIVTVALASAEQLSSLPFPKHSHFEVSNFIASAFDRQGIFVSFNMSPVPQDTVKIVVLGSPTPDLSHRKFTSSDIIKISTAQVTDYNISLLPAFSSMVVQLDSAANFYVTVMPVSYGFFQGNLQPGPQVLGENLQYAGNFPLKKKWKN